MLAASLGIDPKDHLSMSRARYSLLVLIPRSPYWKARECDKVLLTEGQLHPGN